MQELTAEVFALHRSLFGRSPSAKVVEEYVRAHEETSYFRTISDMERRSIETIVSRGLDAVGVEFSLRTGRQHHHLLTRKMLLLCYLCECDGEHPEFRREGVGFVRGFLGLFYFCFFAGIAIARGFLLKWRYRLA